MQLNRLEQTSPLSSVRWKYDLVDKDIEIVPVTTASEMAAECIRIFPLCDIAILAAAVADFTPETISKAKIKKTEGPLLLKLVPTTDIAAELGRIKKPGQLVVGFALETGNELENAQGKLRKKNLDLIVLNSLKDPVPVLVTIQTELHWWTKTIILINLS